jgi:hypothetical protein
MDFSRHIGPQTMASSSDGKGKMYVTDRTILHLFFMSAKRRPKGLAMLKPIGAAPRLLSLGRKTYLEKRLDTVSRRNRIQQLKSIGTSPNRLHTPRLHNL